MASPGADGGRVTAALPVQPQKASGGRRFAWLDVARGLAALCVMIQHSMEGAGFQSLDPGAVATTWLNLGETGVAIFFLVSGFIIPASVHGRPRARDFWIRRAFRIYPLYWFIFLATLAISLVLLQRPAPPAVPTILAHALFVQEWLGISNYVGGSWTLFIELLWYIAFATAFFTGLATGVRLIWLFLAGYAAITVAAALTIPEIFPFGRMSLFALCFFGYLYLLRLEDQVTRRQFTLTAAAFYALIATNIFIGFKLFPSYFHGFPAVTCVAISWSIALVTFPVLLRFRDLPITQSPLLRWLGEISYSVYLIHSPVIVLLVYLGLSSGPLMIATFAITLILATQTFRWIEQPGTELGRRLTSARRRSIPAEVTATAAEGHQAS